MRLCMRMTPELPAYESNILCAQGTSIRSLASVAGVGLSQCDGRHKVGKARNEDEPICDASLSQEDQDHRAGKQDDGDGEQDALATIGLVEILHRVIVEDGRVARRWF